MFGRRHRDQTTAPPVRPVGDPDRPSGATVATAPDAPRSPGHERLAHLWSDGLGTAGSRALQVLLVIALAGCVIYALMTLSLIVLPLLLGLILTCALWPLVAWLRRAVNPMVAAWVVLLGAFVVFGGLLSGIIASVAAQWPTLSNKAREGVTQVQSWVQHLPFSIDPDQTNSLISQAEKFATSAQAGEGAVSGISAAGEFFAGVGILLVVLFFFLKDGDRIWAFFLSWVPERNRPTWERAGIRAQQTFGGYARGTTIIAAVDAVAVGLVMLIAGVPLAFPLAILVFIGAYIPMVGATIAGVLSVLVTLVTAGIWQAVAVAIATVLVQELEGHLLQPVVMGNALQLHGLVILLSLTGGSVLGGVVGALIAVPLVAATWATIKVATGRESPMDDARIRKRHNKARRKARKRLKALHSSTTH